MSNNKNNGLAIEYALGEILCKNKLTISTAESCTGGLVAGKLISYPGISEVFKEGAITYSNEAKMKRLGVKAETLEKFGAVSEETAKEMAEGIAREAETDISVVTTGIAGPGGGTKEKPVGLVYIGIHIKGNTKVEKFNFNGNREEVREEAVLSALSMLKNELSKSK
ncbi:nicotinamide-nucleotide amidohydrolase family protein [Clostridium chauvoei]|uniref:Nicotinamide-nucleotide amidohydrolase family protein n=2 Tax=Clostridium chauvoei TaxID=46867 RepID=A0ABD4RKC0_9CLOT|nr:damage-inducible protein CinA [Clostridium chauvoei]CDG03075.1 Putative competence-damage inducible protein [Clostridium chauvoei JF4335]ATD58510.1 damage-inducible protein CinA [Clostridium chauvoei]MBX7281775.1 nicotinamide-nucleotide amidohydrolase family protein [Clostridium chauvoei]MBX7284296.1 nicotinamide-nucleotide amidohydrolase family protein [Clostridium chauvoei]